jgi:hypothetical protein
MNCMLLELVVLEIFNSYLSDYGSVFWTQGKGTSDPYGLSVEISHQNSGWMKQRSLKLNTGPHCCKVGVRVIPFATNPSFIWLFNAFTLLNASTHGLINMKSSFWST